MMKNLTVRKIIGIVLLGAMLYVYSFIFFPACDLYGGNGGPSSVNHYCDCVGLKIFDWPREDATRHSVCVGLIKKKWKWSRMITIKFKVEPTDAELVCGTHACMENRKRDGIRSLIF